jgi:hypothetical protein
VVYRSPLFVRHEGFAPIQQDDPDDEGDALPWWNHPFHLLGTLATLAKSIRQGTAVAVTDGSFKDTMGTAAYVLQDCLIDPTCRIVSVNQTPGRAKDHTPYRAEIGGVLGIVLTLDKICDEHDIEEGHVTLGCDCESALTTIFEHDYSTPTQANADLIGLTRHHLSSLTVSVTPKKIRAHQDDNKPLHRLSQWELLNVEMDRIAKSYWQALQYFPVQYFDLPQDHHWHVKLCGRRLPTSDKTEIVHHIYADAAQQYWSKKYDIPAPQENVDWTIGHFSIRNSPLHQQLWIPKWMTRRLPIGVTLKRRGYQTTNVCPRCGRPELSIKDVVCCVAPSASKKMGYFS